MPTIPAALQKQERGYEVPLDNPEEQLGQDIPGLQDDARGFESENSRRHEVQGKVAKRPLEVAPEHKSDDDQLGEDAQHIVWSGGSRGEFQHPGCILAFTNVYQL